MIFHFSIESKRKVKAMLSWPFPWGRSNFPANLYHPFPNFFPIQGQQPALAHHHLPGNKNRVHVRPGGGIDQMGVYAKGGMRFVFPPYAERKRCRQ